MKHIVAWDREASIQVTLETLQLIATPLLRRCGPASVRLSELIKNHQWADLLAFEVDYSLDWDVGHLIAVRQVLGLFSKLEPLDLGIDREQEAFDKFLAAEAKCVEVNKRFRTLVGPEADFSAEDPSTLKQLFAAQRLIARVLGRSPGIPELTLRFGPGATTSTKKLDANPCEKFSSGFACSEQLGNSGFLESLLRSLPHWVSAFSVWSNEVGDVVDIDIHDGRLQFVPKNARSYRSIVVEPCLNSMFQQGIRQALELRLTRSGLGVTDQTRNQRAARLGSISGELATIDLSSASDTISYGLVKFLLPDSWFQLLDAARTKTVSYRDQSGVLHVIHQAKFCSMGNAFTFPLETLIFWALSCAAGDPHAIAYGDDIIVSTASVDSVMKLLSSCGFSINTEKSYWQGPFRESCGADYYRGIDIRPAYQKTNLSHRDLFRLHNFFVRNLDSEVAELIKGLIPRSLRLYGPDGYGDGHLLSEVFPRYRTARDASRGYGGIRFDTFSLVGRRVRTRFPGDWVSPLYSIYLSGGMGPDSNPVEVDRHGFPVWDIPGNKGYERKSIYIFG